MYDSDWRQISMLTEEKKKLLIDLQEFSRFGWKQYYKNNRYANLIKIGGLLLSAGVTLAGIYNQGTNAAILGVFIALFIGMQNTFSFDNKANFYKIMSREVEELYIELSYHPETIGIDVILDKFKNIRKREALYQLNVKRDSEK